MVVQIKLIKIVSTSKDAIGQIVKTTVETTVFADVSSISQSEFTSAGQLGLKPELRFLVWNHDYDGQTVIELNNQQYSVYRTYVRTDGRTELYTEKRVGDE